VKWFRKAAEQGNASGQYWLGFCYYNGSVVAQDYAQAVSWYRKAAEQGEDSGQFMLGLCYERGRGVAQDYAEAVKWYRKAAEQKNSAAQQSLGSCYENGQGVAQDYAEAVKWYKLAAEQKNSNAQYSLGACYENGRGVALDLATAVKWYKLAAEQKNKKAQDALKNITGSIGQKVITVVQTSDADVPMYCLEGTVEDNWLSFCSKIQGEPALGFVLGDATCVATDNSSEPVKDVLFTFTDHVFRIPCGVEVKDGSVLVIVCTNEYVSLFGKNDLVTITIGSKSYTTLCKGTVLKELIDKGKTL
jgi:hypothetical protein